MAAQPLVFIVPGLLGSTLASYDEFGQIDETYWLNYRKIATKQLIELALDPSGSDAADPALRGLIKPGPPVRAFYRPLLAKLAEGFNAQYLPYDWRKRIEDEALRMYGVIQSQYAAQDYSMVCHSQGGLLARLIWREAQTQGTVGRIKRIITLGTPHWGSYNALLSLVHQSQTYLELALIYAGFTLVKNFLVQVQDRIINGSLTDQIDSFVGTWPGVYDALPQLGQPNAGDGSRFQIFDARSYSQRNRFVTQQLLDRARSTHLSLAAAQPPDAVLFCVAGAGTATVGNASVPFAPFNSRSQYGTEDGDGSVTVASALLRGHGYRVLVDHADLVIAPSVLDHLAEWLQPAPPADSDGEIPDPGIQPPQGPYEPPRYTPEFPLDPPGPPSVPVGWGNTRGDC